MAEYIDKDRLRLMKTAECAGHTIEYAMGWKVCVEWVKSLPTADVRPVVRGEWNVVEKPLEKATICECSECKHRIWMYDGDDGWNYCPHCGADMREVTP